MKVVFALFVLGFVVCAGRPEFQEWIKDTEILEDEEWSMVPQADGTFRFMYHKDAEREYQLSPEPRSELVVTFQLFTRQNVFDPQFVRENSSSTLVESNYNPNNPTRIITHGWRNNAESALNRLIKGALLIKGDYNVFVVDWSSAAGTYNYFSARYSVPDVATKLADFIDFLNMFGDMKFQNLTLIGHSLGAHVSGLAAKKVQRGKVQNIIGLDPALPLFSYKNPDERLDYSDAHYVQTIHTNGGYLSFHEPLGHGAFYPNWGTSQPGCGFDATGACAHKRSYHYYAESLALNNSFIPFDCLEYNYLLQKNCKEMDITARMGGEPEDFGYVKGIYYVPTNSESPFGLGIVNP